MLTSRRRLGQLFLLAQSHPHYFLHNYRKELANAGYEEVTVAEPITRQTDGAKGHGKKVFSAPSFLKALASGEIGFHFLAEGSDEARDKLAQGISHLDKLAESNGPG